MSLLKLNLKSLLYSFQNNKISIQFENPEDLEKASEEFNRYLYNNYINHQISESILGVQYSVDVENKKIVSSECHLKSVNCTKNSIFDINLSGLESVIDIDPNNLILTWKENKIFDPSGYQGITYRFFRTIGVDVEDFYQYIGLKDYGIPERMYFGVDGETRLSVASISTSDFKLCGISSSVFDYIKLYCEDKSLVCLDILKNEVISIKTIIFGVDEFVLHLNYMKECGCFSEKFIENLNSLAIPENITDITVEFFLGGKCLLQFFTTESSELKQTVYKLAHYPRTGSQMPL